MMGYLVTEDQSGHPQVIEVFRGTLQGGEVIIPESLGLRHIVAEVGQNFFLQESDAQAALKAALIRRAEELEFEQALIKEELLELEESQKADAYVPGQDRLTPPRGGA